MIKRFTYIVLFMALMPALSFAFVRKGAFALMNRSGKPMLINVAYTDTAKSKRQQDDKKIKEIAKAKRQPKPEKLEEPANNAADKSAKPKRQRRPEGLERPPEIPRRSGGG